MFVVFSPSSILFSTHSSQGGACKYYCINHSDWLEKSSPRACMFDFGEEWRKEMK